MGGRGSHVSSPALRERNSDALVNQYNDTNHDTGDYDANGKLTEWQTMSEDDAADKLDEIGNLDVSRYDDGYDFYDNAPYQKFVLNYDLNDMPTVLSAEDFDKYVKATGQPAMVRGYSSKQSRDRVLSNLFHTGTGVYGDGIYFGRETGGYGLGYGAGKEDRLIHVALSPNARVIDKDDLYNEMPESGTKILHALKQAGRNGNYRNRGQSQWALKHGYNVIRMRSGEGDEFYVALTRDALVIKKF